LKGLNLAADGHGWTQIFINGTQMNADLQDCVIKEKRGTRRNGERKLNSLDNLAIIMYSMMWKKRRQYNENDSGSNRYTIVGANSRMCPGRV